MKKFIGLFLFLPLLAEAQYRPRVYREEKKITDSARYYKEKLIALQMEAIDSLRQSEKFQDLYAAYKQHTGKSRNYSGFTLFTGLTHSDLGSFGQHIEANGFSPLSSLALNIGMGFSFRTRRLMIDLYAANGAISRTAKKGNETIKINTANFLQLELGYDLLKSAKASIYPFAGLSGRSSTIKYEKPETVNNNAEDITGFIINNQSVTAQSGKVGYQAGVGFDYSISSPQKTPRATLLFLKAGIQGPIGGDRYKMNGHVYHTDLKQGNWVINIGFKFIVRH